MYSVQIPNSEFVHVRNCFFYGYTGCSTFVCLTSNKYHMKGFVPKVFISRIKK